MRTASCTGHVFNSVSEADCCRQVAALYSDHYRQVLLYMILLDQGRLAVVDRWLPCTVTSIDRSYCVQFSALLGKCVRKGAVGSI